MGHRTCVYEGRACGLLLLAGVGGIYKGFLVGNLVILFRERW